MKGGDSVIRTLVNAGIDVCFTNPGTTEMCLVDAIDKSDGMRPVLGLFEGVVSGAADGYARMAGKPACTLLHLGPGMANGIANFHNAARAHSPMIALIGDHATWLKPYDPPLNADIASYARPFSGWYRETVSAQSLAQDAVDAAVAANEEPGQIATLVVRADHAWAETEQVLSPTICREKTPVLEDTLSALADAIKKAKQPVFYINGSGLQEGALRAVDRIVQASGGDVFAETHNPRLQRGAGRAPIRVIPYYPAVAMNMLKEADLLVLVETGPPGSFFAFPQVPATFHPEDCPVMTLSVPGEDSEAALESLAERLAPGVTPRSVPLKIPDLPSGDLTAEAVGQVIGHYLPENAIISDESITSAFGAAMATATAQPHDYLQLTGGALGQGLPVGLGAAVACPDRKVICLVGDGSALYTIQSLWTMAREKLDVTVVVLSNRSYGALHLAYAELGLGAPGPKATSLFDLNDPEIDFIHLAKGMGVDALRAQSAEDFSKVFEDCMARKGPHLIEAVFAASH